MRIAVCDDDLREQEQFEAALRGWDPTRSVEKFIDGASFLEAARNAPPFDIAFLDIYLPGEDGIGIAKALREISPETAVVFVTVSREHAVDAFSLCAAHYLIKPVTTEGVVEAFRRLSQARRERRKRITLTAERGRHTVFLDQICLMESADHAVIVSLSDGRRLKVRMSFSELEKKLDGNFLRINRGIVVNMDSIAQMGTDTCILQSGIRLPIAIRRRVAIRAAYDDYVFDRLSQRRILSGEGNA